MKSRLRVLLAALVVAQSAAPAFAAGVELPALPGSAIAAPVAFQVPGARGQFFNELDLHLAGLERSFDPSDLSTLTRYLEANLPAAGATAEQLAARQVLLGALARPELRADAEGTLKFAARGMKSPEEAAIAERLAQLARRVEAADAQGTMSQRLASLQDRLFGDKTPRDAVGSLLDRLFDATPPIPEGAPVYQKPGAEKDDFGRTNGWEDVKPEPADAPKSFKDIDLTIPKDARRAVPGDIRDQSFYYVMIDRFGRVYLPGERPATWGDPNDARTRHGGNIKGLIAKLDYLKPLATTIVVSPIVMNNPAAYHGYSPIHRAAVAPELGTMEDLKTLKAELDKRGMFLVIDRVFNQTGPILKYKGGFKYSETPKEIERVRYPLKPSEYLENGGEHFSRRGDINDWNSEEQKQHGDLPGGIPRLASENPHTQDLLIKETNWWIKVSGEIGARVDALPHLAPGFLERMFPETRAYSKKAGLDSYFYLGELFEGDPHKYIPWLKEGRLDAAYNYISYYWNDAALHGRAPTSVLEGSFHKLGEILGPAVHRLVNFLGNHDRLHFLGANDPVGVLHFALSYVFTSIGMPYLYGEEQAPRRVPGRKWLDIEAAREDRFEGGKFKNPAMEGHEFDVNSEGYQLAAKLKALRDEHAALRRGEQYVRWSDPTGPGIFAFSRVHAGEEVLVVLNSSGQEKEAEMWVDRELTPDGATLVDKMGGGEIQAYSKDGGSKVYVKVPAYGTRIFVRKVQ